MLVHVLLLLAAQLAESYPENACIPDVLDVAQNWGGCTAANGWLEMLTDHLPSLFSPRPVFINVGANKGYEAPRFLSLWSQRASVSVKSWQRGIRDVAAGRASVDGETPRKYGFLRSQPCGACSTVCRGGVKRHARDGGTVHLLELAVANAKLLRYLAVATNSSDLISVHNIAASNESGTAHARKVMIGWEQAGMLDPHSFRIKRKQSDLVIKLTVDDFLDRERLPKIIDLVVVDTEGHDPYVLEGMRGALASKRITLLEFEYSNKWPTHPYSLGKTLTSLAADGYRCYMESRTRKRAGSEVLAPLSPPCWEAALEKRKWSNVVCSHEPRALAMLDAAAWVAFDARKKGRG